uniref:Mitogen-activated protein kinase n=1 Tax=Tetraselmis chuii TaxID=63592 RepID=A0A7S1T7A9_9CHLO
MLDNLPGAEPRDLKHLFPNASTDALDLLRKLLHFNPQKRITAEEALRHPYVAQFHNAAEEPSCSRTVTIPINDNTKYSISEYREKLYSEIVKRKKELRKRAKERESGRSRSSHKESRH